MRRLGCLHAMPALAVLATASISARAEVPQSHVVPPREDRMGPHERAQQEEKSAWEAGVAVRSPGERLGAHREARRRRTVGIVFTAVGAGFAPFGGLLLADGLSHRDSTSWWTTTIGGGLLAIGGLSLVIGIPTLVSGVSDSKATALPTIQIGPRSAALTWSF